MSAAALAWLAERVPPAPAPLYQRMAAAVGTQHDASVPAALAEAALTRLHAALALGDTRAAAFELLAADALLSYAFEAAAELGVDTLEAVIDAYGPARMAPLITVDE